MHKTISASKASRDWPSLFSLSAFVTLQYVTSTKSANTHHAVIFMRAAERDVADATP